MCSAGTTGRITSGGGFSQKYSQPDYQAKAVSEYFINAAAAGKTPYPGFNAGGRAYPDISMNGLNYLTILYGNYAGHAGTSASTPVAAAAVSNINAARMAIGKGSLGWLNPALYTHAASFVNDIVIGNNTCSATAPCCPHGFHATKGWDPATGLGSINYGKMEATFLALGAITNAVTNFPTPSPTTSKPTPSPTTSMPTVEPTESEPTAEPTERTRKPSRGKPSRRPTADPTARPNRRRPTFRPSATNANAAPDDDYVAPEDTKVTAPSTVRATLTLAGIAVQETTDAAFTKAVANTVISVIGVPDATVTDITTTSSGRRLLSSVVLSYTVSVAKDMTPEQLIASLQTSLSSGDFLTTLSKKSGLTIDDATNLQTVDLSHAETPAPTTAGKYHTRTHRIAVAVIVTH